MVPEGDWQPEGKICALRRLAVPEGDLRCPKAVPGGDCCPKAVPQLAVPEGEWRPKAALEAIGSPKARYVARRRIAVPEGDLHCPKARCVPKGGLGCPKALLGQTAAAG